MLLYMKYLPRLSPPNGAEVWNVGLVHRPAGGTTVVVVVVGAVVVVVGTVVVVVVVGAVVVVVGGGGDPAGRNAAAQAFHPFVKVPLRVMLAFCAPPAEPVTSSTAIVPLPPVV
jgi:hypothetical protein